MSTTFRTKNRTLAENAVATLTEEQPMTLRQLFYPSTSGWCLDDQHRHHLDLRRRKRLASGTATVV